MVDLHLHSTASDGLLAPAAVVQYARAAGLAAIALTDHDTLEGIPAARGEGERLGMRVVAGCEFSVAAPWGEMHLLGYFLEPGDPAVEPLLTACRADRVRRAEQMVARLQAAGCALRWEALQEEVGTAWASIGRPHVARALVAGGMVGSVDEAFQRYLGRGRAAFVEKTLPSLEQVAEAVHRAGGLTAAAHLGGRATRRVLENFRQRGLDGIEVRHPSHSPDLQGRLEGFAQSLGLLMSGGSDWHGDPEGGDGHAAIGSQAVPAAWLEGLDTARARGASRASG